YRRLAKKFSDDAKIAELFKGLAADEDVHRKQFTKLLDAAEKVDEDNMDYERKQYLRAMSISEFFSKNHGPFKDAAQFETGADALQAAFGLEKSLVAFYSAMRDVLGENPILEEIIQAEKQHAVAVMKLMMTDAKYRTLQDPWA
ncbi:MAG: ferritin-like domain-containing protein, partial [Deltaproteobacteria bacterium]|nr:ferritin-like domain-containing protein [Deltaproteobacteria bacterium]